MALPAYPNAISLSQIRSGFGTSANKFSQLYQNDAGPVYTGQVGYPYNGAATNVPSSGTIRIANFSGATPYFPSAQSFINTTPGNYSWTVPTTLISNLTIYVFGAGGGGAGWPSNAGGGGGGGGAVWVGRPTAGTVISYSVGGGGTRGAGGSSGANGGNTGASSSVFSVTGYGGTGGQATRDGSYQAPGGSGNVSYAYGVGYTGTGGSGASLYNTYPATNATSYGGGGGASDTAGALGGGGAGGGGSGGNNRQNGYAAGGGGGGDGGTGGNGGNGIFYITGTW